MAWTRIDDGFRTNIKVRKAGPDGVLLYIYGLLHCNTNLTDGYIDDVFLPQIYADAFCRTPKVTVKKLVDCGLWIKVDGGYQVNDYLEYNFTKEEIEKRRQAKAEAGRKGGRTSTGSKLEAEYEATDKAFAQASAQASAQAKSNPIPITHTDKDLNKPPLLYAHDELVDSVVKTYEQEIGKLTPAVMDDILTVIDDYPLEWFAEAFKEASRNNKPNWRYALAILKRWKVDGYKVDTRVKRAYNGSRPTKPPSASLDEILDGAPIFAEDKK